MDLVTILCQSALWSIAIYILRFWLKGLWLSWWNYSICKRREKKLVPAGQIGAGIWVALPVMVRQRADYVGTLAVCSHKRRGDLVYIRPGKGKRRSDRHARKIADALLHYQLQPWLIGVRFYYVQKLRNLSERGHWHDLTDSRWRLAQYVVACQRLGLKDGSGLGNAGNTHWPSPDLAHSNFDSGYIVYRSQYGVVDVDKAGESNSHFEHVWGCKVAIEPYAEIPGAIVIRRAPKLDPRPRSLAITGTMSDEMPFGRDRFTHEDIKFDLRKLQKRTHIAVIAGSGAGKSNLIGCFLGWFAAKAREVRPDPLIGKVYLIDPTGAAGMGCYEEKGVTIACDEEDILEVSSAILRTYNERKSKMIEDETPWWTGPIDVVIFDELAENPRAFNEVFAGWVKEFRKRGILLIFCSQRMRDLSGVPVDIPANCAIKIALRVEEQRDATEFLRVNEYKPGAEPGMLEPGEFILKYPGLGIFYGQADLAEHEQLALAAE